LLLAAQAAAADFMLSFDDGPLPHATERILQALKGIRAEDGQPVRAAFFLVGAAPHSVWEQRKYFAPYELWNEKGSLAEHPEIAREILAAGHLIGSHSMHHTWFRWPWLSSVEDVRQDLRNWEKVAAQVSDPKAPRLYRPPYFVDTEAVRIAIAQAGYQMVQGVSSGDAAPLATPYSVMENTAWLLRHWPQDKPCVLTFHDTRVVTQNHLAEIVNELKARGFHLQHFDPARLSLFPDQM